MSIKTHNAQGLRRPILEVTIKGLGNTGKTTLALKIRELLRPLGLEVEVEDSEYTEEELEAFVASVELTEILQQRDPKIVIKMAEQMRPGSDTDAGYVPLPHKLERTGAAVDALFLDIAQSTGNSQDRTFGAYLASGVAAMETAASTRSNEPAVSKEAATDFKVDIVFIPENNKTTP